MPTRFSTAHLDTPIGILAVRGTENGIASINFLDEHPESLESDDHLEPCIHQLQEYFDGKRIEFHSLSLRYPATDFQREVWDALMDVPFGQTVSYGELAERSGHRGAARAVGTAMNVNPLPIIIPCHRVLPSSGNTGQYAGGQQRKEWLLRHETC